MRSFFPRSSPGRQNDRTMARTDQHQKSAFLEESTVDIGSLLPPISTRDSSPPQDRKDSQRARRLLSLGALGESLLDLLVAICCAYFIVFAALVYTRRDQPLDQPGNQDLLEAAKYVSTALLALSVSYIAPGALQFSY